MNTHISNLKNGMTVVTAHMPGFESTFVGAFVKVGSRFERVEVNGISHFLEHMAFKGTKRRNAFDIAMTLENVGGIPNAFTSKEVTAYHCKTLAPHSSLSLDIISDVLRNSVFDPSEIDLERGVILQEKKRSFDNPGNLAFEFWDKVAYPDQAAGRTILGEPEVIQRLQRDDFQDYIDRHYTAKNMIIVGVGKIDHDAFHREAEYYFGGFETGMPNEHERTSYVGGFHHHPGEFEQTSLVLGFPTPALHDPRRPAVELLSHVLGGGMSSPLFQEVREKRGLVYTVASFANVTHDLGEFSIYAGTSTEHLNEVLDVALGELLKLTDSVNTDDLRRAKNQHEAAVVMERESPFNLAMSMVEDLLNYGRIRASEELIAAYEHVTAEEISAAAQTLVTQKPTLSMVGPIDDSDYYARVIERLRLKA